MTNTNTRILGTVKWFNATKGYGFIAVEGQRDTFVHISKVEEIGLDTLVPHQPIHFSLGDGRNGRLMAVNLEIGNPTGEAVEGASLIETPMASGEDEQPRRRRQRLTKGVSRHVRRRASDDEYSGQASLF